MQLNRSALTGTFIKLILSLIMWGPVSAIAQVRTEIKAFSDSFISPTFEATQKTNYQFVGGAIKTDPFTDDFLKMDVAGGVALGAPLLNYLNISELYLQKRSGSESFYIGRKKILWNELDGRWDLGVWQPMFKWNPLNPESQGLVGIFWEIDKPFYNLLLFASPMFIPDQGASFEIKDGSFVRANPWAARPPESVRILGVETGIDYNVNMPDELEIVMQNSFGLKASYGDPRSLRIQGSYTYKPANQLMLNYEGKLNNGNLRSAVNIHPEVFYHSLAGLDVTYRRGRWNMGVSGIYDHPTNSDSSPEFTHPVFSEALLSTAFIEWSNARWSFNLQYLEVFGGEVTEVGELASADRPPIMNRYPFTQAQQMAILYNSSVGGRKVMTKMTYINSQKNQFDLVRLSARMQLSGLWSVVGEMQLVKAERVNQRNRNDIAQFENNDRLMMGAAYVF